MFTCWRGGNRLCRKRQEEGSSLWPGINQHGLESGSFKRRDEEAVVDSSELKPAVSLEDLCLSAAGIT